MKFFCRIGFHKWSKWEKEGVYKVTTTPNMHLYWIKYETTETKYERFCQHCGKPEVNYTK